MKLSPRSKLLLVVALFALPIVASYVAYHLVRPNASANHGELLLPPAAIAAHPLRRIDGSDFRFAELAGKWILVASDSGACPEACAVKLTAMRQVRLALGRDAARIARVFVVDDLQAPQLPVDTFEGMVIALTPTGLATAPGAIRDRAHVYLVDPRGNVMLRWSAATDPKRMLQDVKRLLKASQIG